MCSLVILTVAIVYYYSKISPDNNIVIEKGIVEEDINQVEPIGEVELHSIEEVPGEIEPLNEVEPLGEVEPEDEVEDLF